MPCVNKPLNSPNEFWLNSTRPYFSNHSGYHVAKSLAVHVSRPTETSVPGVLQTPCSHNDYTEALERRGYLLRRTLVGSSHTEGGPNTQCTGHEHDLYKHTDHVVLLPGGSMVGEDVDVEGWERLILWREGKRVSPPGSET